MSTKNRVSTFAGTKSSKQKLDWKTVGNINKNHIIKIAFRPYTDQKSPFASVTLGRLFVEFSKYGGKDWTNTYVYEGISYSQFYYLWKRAGRRGTYFHYYIRTSYPYRGVSRLALTFDEGSWGKK